MKKYFLLLFQSKLIFWTYSLHCLNKCVVNVVDLDIVLKYKMGFGARHTWVGSPALQLGFREELHLRSPMSHLSFLNAVQWMG